MHTCKTEKEEANPCSFIRTGVLYKFEKEFRSVKVGRSDSKVLKICAVSSGVEHFFDVERAGGSIPSPRTQMEITEPNEPKIREVEYAGTGFGILDYPCKVSIKEGKGTILSPNGLDWKPAESDQTGVYTPPIKLQAHEPMCTFLIEEIKYGND